MPGLAPPDFEIRKTARKSLTGKNKPAIIYLLVVSKDVSPQLPRKVPHPRALGAWIPVLRLVNRLLIPRHNFGHPCTRILGQEPGHVFVHRLPILAPVHRELEGEAPLLALALVAAGVVVVLPLVLAAHVLRKLVGRSVPLEALLLFLLGGGLLPRRRGPSRGGLGRVSLGLFIVTIGSLGLLGGFLIPGLGGFDVQLDRLRGDAWFRVRHVACTALYGI